MKKLVFVLLLTAVSYRPCLAQFQPVSAPESASQQQHDSATQKRAAGSSERAEIERLREENNNLKDANTRMEIEKLRAENSRLQATNNVVQQSQDGRQSDTAAGPATKHSRWRQALHKVGNAMQNAGANVQNIAPRTNMQTSTTRFSNGMTATTTSW